MRVCGQEMGDCERDVASTLFVAVQVSPPARTLEQVVILAYIEHYVNRRYYTTDATLFMGIFNFPVSFVDTFPFVAAKVDSNLHCRTSDLRGECFCSVTCYMWLVTRR